MFEKNVEIPEGVNVRVDGNNLVVSGPKGQLERVFKHHMVKLELKDNVVRVFSDSDRRKQKALVGTWAAHIRNMIGGVTKGWEARLRAVYSHFPMKLNIEGDMFVVQNFLGEKSPRTAKILPGVDVKIEKNDIIVTGIDRERVGETASNIEISTKVTGYDRRVFQDGCYLVQKTKLIGGDSHAE